MSSAYRRSQSAIASSTSRTAIAPDGERRGEPSEEEDERGRCRSGALATAGGGTSEQTTEERGRISTARIACRASSRSPEGRTRRTRCRGRRRDLPAELLAVEEQQVVAEPAREEEAREQTREQRQPERRRRAGRPSPCTKAGAATAAPKPSSAIANRTRPSRSSSRRRPRSRGSPAASSPSAGWRAGRAGRQPSTTSASTIARDHRREASGACGRGRTGSSSGSSSGLGGTRRSSRCRRLGLGPLAAEARGRVAQRRLDPGPTGDDREEESAHQVADDAHENRDGRGLGEAEPANVEGGRATPLPLPQPARGQRYEPRGVLRRRSPS